jgi:hypothetical protein
MRRLLVCLVVCAACGDDGDTSPPPGGIAGQLAALPGVTVEARSTATQGYEFFVLGFEQPVDHTVAGGPTFRQRA